MKTALQGSAVDAFGEQLANLSTMMTEAKASFDAATDLSEKSTLGKRLKAIEDAQSDLSERLNKAKRNSLPGIGVADSEHDVGPDKFSFARMAQICVTGGMKSRFATEKSHGVEVEVYKQLAGNYNDIDNVVKAELNASSGESGAFLIPSEVQSTLIPILREITIARALGATSLTGLVGNIIWNRQSSDVAAYHINTEASEALTTSRPGFERIEMRPHVVGALVPITYEMQTQTATSMEAFVRNAIAQQIAIAQDQNVFTGTGAGSLPRGLLNHPQILSLDWSVSIGGDSLFFGDAANAQTATKRLIKMWLKIRKQYAAFGRLGWASSCDALAKLSSVVDRDGAPLLGQPGNLLVDSLLRPAYTLRETELLDDAADTNENLIFGNWSDLVIGEWAPGMVFAVSNSDADDFKYGKVKVRGFMAYDVTVWRGSSFCKAVGIPAL